MKAESLSSILASALILAGCAMSYGQQAPISSAPNTNPSAKVSTAANVPPLTEDALRKRYVGQMVFVRGDYVSDDLQFDENGKIKGSPQTTSFTLSAVEVRKVHLTKRSLEIEGDRYGLHFFGALPYEDASAQPYDKVKISKKPVRISIEREVVVIPKAKKQKKGKAEKGPVAPSGVQSQPSAAATAPAAPLAPGTTSSPAHSAMMMNTALDNVLALGIDQKMIASLPSYWQEYFKSRNEHRQFTPAGARVPGDGVSAPKVLNSITPSSNEYAQKYGIAGLTLFRTVVDASGVPQEIAIARPIGFGLDEKAVQAIKASRFTPATFNGQAVPAVIDVVVTFRIYSNRTKPGSVPKGSKPANIAASAWDSAPAVK